MSGRSAAAAAGIPKSRHVSLRGRRPAILRPVPSCGNLSCCRSDRDRPPGPPPACHTGDRGSCSLPVGPRGGVDGEPAPPLMDGGPHLEPRPREGVQREQRPALPRSVGHPRRDRGEHPRDQEAEERPADCGLDPPHPQPARPRAPAGDVHPRPPVLVDRSEDLDAGEPRPGGGPRGARNQSFLFSTMIEVERYATLQAPPHSCPSAWSFFRTRLILRGLTWSSSMIGRFDSPASSMSAI